MTPRFRKSSRTMLSMSALTAVLAVLAVGKELGLVPLRLSRGTALAAVDTNGAIGPTAIDDSLWDSLVNAGEIIGSRQAPITIAEFSDFQCPFCREFWQNLKYLEEVRPGTIRLVYLNYPLVELHPFAEPAAVAAACAGEQGYFAQYHDALFARQEQIEGTNWSEFGRDANIPDDAGFRGCISTGKSLSHLLAQAELARRLGVNATPTIWLNGRALTPPLTVKMVDSILATGNPK